MVKNTTESAFDQLIEKEKAFCTSVSELSFLESNLGCVDGQIIGTGRSDYTQSSTEYRLNVYDKDFILIDIPGIEGDESKYRDAILNSLAKAHVIFYVNASGKKIEKNTLEKIKKYMHDGTSVYAIINVHCNAKKNRVEGIDKNYRDELADVYKKQSEIVDQTEEELKSFLGDNYKGSICLHGLLSFSSMAVDNGGNTTIVNDKDKNLRSTQAKFLNEYSGNTPMMRVDSHILDIQGIIADKIEHFDEYIFEENIKKLKTRLSDMREIVSNLRNIEKNKLHSFQSNYDSFEGRCEFAKDDFIRSIERIGINEVTDAFTDVREALFEAIEDYGGKLDEYVVRAIFNEHKEKIVENIGTSVSESINEAVNEYRESVEEARKRLFKDMERDQQKFEITMESSELNLDASFVKNLKIGAKDIMFGLIDIGGVAFSGFEIGSMICPGLGSIIGAIIGGILGFGIWLWSKFTSKAKRINKAKAQMNEALDEQIDSVVDKLQTEIEKLEIVKIVNDKHDEIIDQITVQRKALKDTESILDSVRLSLNNSYTKLQRYRLTGGNHV